MVSGPPGFVLALVYGGGAALLVLIVVMLWPKDDDRLERGAARVLRFWQRLFDPFTATRRPRG